MNTKPVKVPQVILDTCPLPETHHFAEETSDRFAGIWLSNEDIDVCMWISRSPSLYVVNDLRNLEAPFPPETTDEELWRYVYAQFILGDNNG